MANHQTFRQGFGVGSGGSPGLFFDDEEERERLEVAPEELYRIEADVFGKVGDSGPPNLHRKPGASRTSGGSGGTEKASQSWRNDRFVQALDGLDAEVGKIPPRQKGSYLEALRQCPYELSADRRTAFLWREDFDAAAAARRLVRYWERRLQLFGHERCFVPLTAEALTDDEVAVLSGGLYVTLPRKDDAGRTIVAAYLTKRDMSIPRVTILRAVWYLLHCILEDPETQKHGFILLVNSSGATFGKFDPKLASSILELEKVFLPLRLRAQHLCYPPNFLRAIKPIINSFLGRQMRMRHCVHGGSTQSVLNELGGYGISPDRLPRDFGGTLDFRPELWLIERLEVEQRRGQDAADKLDVLATAVLHAEQRDCAERLTSNGAELVEEEGDERARKITKKSKECIAPFDERKESLSMSTSTPVCSEGMPSLASTLSHPVQPQAVDMQQQLPVAAETTVVGGVRSISAATNNACFTLPGASVNVGAVGAVSSAAAAQQQALVNAARLPLLHGQTLPMPIPQAANAIDPGSILQAPSIAAATSSQGSAGALTTDRLVLSNCMGLEAGSAATSAGALQPDDIVTFKRLLALAAGMDVAEASSLGARLCSQPVLNGINIKALAQALGASAGAGAGLRSNLVPSFASALVACTPQRQAVLNQMSLQRGVAGSIGVCPSIASIGLTPAPQDNTALQLAALLQQQQQPVPFRAHLSSNLVDASPLHSVPGHLPAAAPPEVPSTRLPRILYVASDNMRISDYQMLVRKQAEAFVATEEHVHNFTRGRVKPILPGQVGIRCRHCKGLPLKSSPRGSIYFPSELVGMYQTAQKMATLHLASVTTPCPSMPSEVRELFRKLSASKSTVGGGKHYWAEAGRTIGLVDSPNGIRLRDARPP